MQDRTIWRFRYEELATEALHAKLDGMDPASDHAGLIRSVLERRALAAKLEEAMATWTLELGRAMFSQDAARRQRGRAIAAAMLADRLDYEEGDVLPMRDVELRPSAAFQRREKR